MIAAEVTSSPCAILRVMDEPEYLICMHCETATYQFEFGERDEVF